MIPRYENKSIYQVWSDKYRFQLYCDLEIELLNKFINVNKIKENHVKRIVLTDSDVEEIKNIEKTTKHELASVVDFLHSRIDNRFIHFGLTSSDILDTAYTMQIYASTQELFNKILPLLNKLSDLQELHRHTMMCGRTHGQVAEIISLGGKLNVFGSILDNYYADIEDSLRNYLAVKVSGPTGNKWHEDFGKFIPSEVVEKAVKDIMSRNDVLILNVNSYSLQTQNINRNFYFNIYKNIISFFVGLESLVLELRLMSQSGIEEFTEKRAPEQKGSSSMPHKCNPIVLENIYGLIQVIKSYMTPLMNSCTLWSERDMSHSSIERIVVPDLFHLSCDVVEKICNVLLNGEFLTENMLNNIDKKENDWKSSYILNHLIYNGKTRSEAYNLVKNDPSIYDQYKHITKEYIFDSIKKGMDKYD